MSTNNFWKSDLFGLYNVIQASMIVYPKEAIISALRNFFSQCSFYHFASDSFGFANTTDHTDLPLGADMPYGPGANPQLNPDPVLPTRVFIGQNYRYNGIFYPAILVKSGGSKYIPISMNRNQGTIQYGKRIFVDGYGNESVISIPESIVTAGVWEGSIIVDVLSRSLEARDELAEIIGMFFAEISFDSLHQIGIVVKPPNIGAPTEMEDRNDKLFKQSITLDIRTEWRREIPIKNTVDAILFTADYGNFAKPNSNMEIVSDLSIIDTLLDKRLK